MSDRDKPIRVVKTRRKIKEDLDVRASLLYSILDILEEQGREQEIEMYKDMSRKDLETTLRQLKTDMSPYDGVIVDELTKKEWIEEGNVLPEILDFDLSDIEQRNPEVEEYLQISERRDQLRPHVAFGLVQEQRREQGKSSTAIPVEETPSWQTLQIIKRNDASHLFEWAEDIQEEIALGRRKREEEEGKEEKKRSRFVTPTKGTSVSPTPGQTQRFELTPKGLEEMGCVVCGDEVKSRCRACKKAYYCSNGCRKFHKMTIHKGCKA